LGVAIGLRSAKSSHSGRLKLGKPRIKLGAVASFSRY